MLFQTARATKREKSRVKIKVLHCRRAFDAPTWIEWPTFIVSVSLSFAFYSVSTKSSTAVIGMSTSERKQIAMERNRERFDEKTISIIMKSNLNFFGYFVSYTFDIFFLLPHDVAVAISLFCFSSGCSTVQTPLFTHQPNAEFDFPFSFHSFFFLCRLFFFNSVCIAMKLFH